MTVGELRQRMSSAEMAGWIAYNRLGTIGPERADLHTAMQMAQTANMNRDTSRRPEPFDVMDFMPFQGKPQKEEGEFDAKQFGQRLKAFFSGKRKG